MQGCGSFITKVRHNMKVSGQTVEGPNEDILVLPRGTNNIVFKGRAVLDYDMFNKLRPVPKPPGIRTREGFKPDLKDVGYKEQMGRHALAHMGYTVINTLQDIEWDTVKLDDPTTWTNWVDDLVKAGFSAAEQQRILNFVLEVNALDEAKMEAARADFLAGQDQA